MYTIIENLLFSTSAVASISEYVEIQARYAMWLTILYLFDSVVLIGAT